MSAQDNGGPAFPTENARQTGNTTWHYEGMALRDYFAAKALAGGLEQSVRDDMDIGWWHKPQVIAKRAYAIADAMLAARKGTP